MAAWLDLPRQPLAIQPWIPSLRLPTLAARLAALQQEGWLCTASRGTGWHGLGLGPSIIVVDLLLLPIDVQLACECVASMVGTQ